MKDYFKYPLLLITFFLFLYHAVAHEKQVHQYLALQAYELLKSQYPSIQYTSMATQLGLQDGPEATCGGVGLPWTDGLITRGAFREDCQDMVYHGQDERTITNSHFWDADAGDNQTNHICVPECADWENAFQKVRHYVNGDYSFMLLAPLFYPPDLAAGSGVIYIKYNSLIDLYKTRRLYITGFMKNGEGEYFYDHPILLTDHILLGSGYNVQGLAQTVPWEVLGRMAHLLGDMSVPAHAHMDPHCANYCADGEDWFEKWEWNQSHYLEENAQTARQQGELLDVYSAVHASDYYRQLRYLFYTTNQMADRFPSNSADGDLQYQLLSSDGDDYSVLGILSGTNADIDHSNLPPVYYLGSHPELFDNLGREINNYAFRFDIRSIAGLFYWFAVETGILNRVTVQTSFNGGTVSIDGVDHSSGYTIVRGQGETFTLNVVDQDWPNEYGVSTHRLFYEWNKKVNSEVVSTHNDRQWSNLPVTESATYVAELNKQFNVQITSPTFLELQGSGTYTVNGSANQTHWDAIFTENVSSTIELDAIASPGSSFVKWSDGTQAPVITLSGQMRISMVCMPFSKLIFSHLFPLPPVRATSGRSRQSQMRNIWCIPQAALSSIQNT